MIIQRRCGLNHINGGSALIWRGVVRVLWRPPGRGAVYEVLAVAPWIFNSA